MKGERMKMRREKGGIISMLRGESDLRNITKTRKGETVPSRFMMSLDPHTTKKDDE